MRYFVSDNHWDLEGYAQQLRTSSGRMPAVTFRFWTSSSFHDAYLVNMTLRNLFFPGFPRRKNPSVVELQMLHENGYDYLIRYSGVVKASLDFDGRAKTYEGLDGATHFWEEDRRGLDQWAYDELTSHDETYLSHEIRFQSDATLLLHFQRMQIKRSQCKRAHDS